MHKNVNENFYLYVVELKTSITSTVFSQNDRWKVNLKNNKINPFWRKTYIFAKIISASLREREIGTLLGFNIKTNVQDTINQIKMRILIHELLKSV